MGGLLAAPTVGECPNTKNCPDDPSEWTDGMTSHAYEDAPLDVCFDPMTFLPIASPIYWDVDAPDLDHDGYLDEWEVDGGIDTNCDGIIDVELPDAKPTVADLYLEIDCLQDDLNGDGDADDAGEHSHCPKLDAISQVVSSFGEGWAIGSASYEGIALHVDIGDLAGAGRVFTVVSSLGVEGTYGDYGEGSTRIVELGNEIITTDDSDKVNTQLSDLKANNFPDRRRGFWRYGIFGHQTNSRRASDDCTSGVSSSGSQAFLVTLGGTNPSGRTCHEDPATMLPIGSFRRQAGTLMHEFGHQIGLPHGGSDSVNRKPHYLSVMNYRFQFDWVRAYPHRINGETYAGCIYDYGAVPLDLDENNFDECLGLGGGFAGFGAVDINNDGNFDGPSCPTPTSGIHWDLNGDGACVVKDGMAWDTSPENDDFVVGDTIVSGPDHVCDTTANNDNASGDDDQENDVGTVTERVLVAPGSDFERLLLDWRKGPNFEAPGIIEEDDDHATAEQREAEALRASAQVRPLTVVVDPGLVSGVPDEIVTIPLQLRNEGFGPAFEVHAVVTFPDGTAVVVDRPILRLGEEDGAAVSYKIPSGACPGAQPIEVRVQAKGYYGADYEQVATFAIDAIDDERPTLELKANAFTMCQDTQQVVQLTPPVVHDNCDADLHAIGEIFAFNGVAIDPPIVIPNDYRLALRPGTYSVRWSATDEGGNASTSMQEVVVSASAALGLCCSSAAYITVTGSESGEVLASYANSTQPIYVDARGGDDVVATGSGDDCVFGGNGGDNLSSTSGADRFFGGPGGDNIALCQSGFGGSVEVYAGSGAQTVSVQYCSGSALYGGAQVDKLTGSSTGADIVHPGGGADQVNTGGGNDTVLVYDVCELVSGEVLNGGPGADTLILPISLAAAQARGVSISNFETVVVQTDKRHLALCQ
jgi:hypothetical protein